MQSKDCERHTLPMLLQVNLHVDFTQVQLHLTGNTSYKLASDAVPGTPCKDLSGSTCVLSVTVRLLFTWQSYPWVRQHENICCMLQFLDPRMLAVQSVVPTDTCFHSPSQVVFLQCLRRGVLYPPSVPLVYTGMPPPGDTDDDSD